MNLQDLIINSTSTISQNKEENSITIFAGHSKEKLSNLIKDFPDNCYVNKKITGCGGTTLVLRNAVNYVVLVPYINLLKSKVADNQDIVDLIGVYGETDSEEITAYLESGAEPKKIVCTYDSLPKLLRTKGFNPKAFKLLVDEAHTLVNLGSFKAATCEFVLQNYTKFASYVFLTATPTKREYFPEALINVPLCTIQWDDVRNVKFNLQNIEQGIGLNNALFGLCYDYLLGKIEGNAHIFYNSVSEIASVLGKLKDVVDKETGKNLFDPKDIRVVCSKSGTNQKTFNSKLGTKWASIADITDPVRKINLYTSTAFEGADVLDEEGQTYIIINGVRDATKVDFHVLVPQIVGRIRNTKYNEHINLLVANLPEAASCTKDEWMSTVTKRIQNSRDVLHDIRESKMSEASKAQLIKAAEEDKYTFKNEQGELYVSDVALKAELQAYEALEATYVVRVVEGAEISDEGYSASFRSLLTDESKHVPFAHKPKGISKFLTGHSQCFYETMKEYCEARDEQNEKLYKLVDAKDDYFKTAYDTLKHETIRKLEYRKPAIERAMKIHDTKNENATEIPTLLNLKKDQVYLRSDIKAKIQDIYDKLAIPDKAKATDITKWYEVKDTRQNSKPAFKVIKML
ncbi:DEAD/DEAH box helicase family protein [Acinetobacter baumannii]|uniref:DEAD/DEAH box helicase family protein n=1 Tax=Acinetobacter baumannii TaxID=470 RepID=UPI001A91C5D6|nr:DEAD/DEAH box helicase family protein [Acinetobacter baumannii]MBO0660859.1 DEAD/DEAH box helicase family protein [Acinetobacter baumannii]